MSDLPDQLRIAATFLDLEPQRNNDAEIMRAAANEIERLTRAIQARTAMIHEFFPNLPMSELALAFLKTRESAP